MSRKTHDISCFDIIYIVFKLSNLILSLYLFFSFFILFLLCRFLCGLCFLFLIYIALLFFLFSFYCFFGLSFFSWFIDSKSIKLDFRLDGFFNFFLLLFLSHRLLQWVHLLFILLGESFWQCKLFFLAFYFLSLFFNFFVAIFLDCFIFLFLKGFKIGFLYFWQWSFLLDDLKLWF